MSLIAWSLLTLRIAAVIAVCSVSGSTVARTLSTMPVHGALLVRDVDAGAAVVGRPANLLVADDADDFPRDVRAELGLARDDLLNQDALADRILVLGSTRFARRSFITSDRRRIPGVAVGQRSALEQLDAERREVRRADDLEEAARPIGAIDHRPAGHLHRHPVAGALHAAARSCRPSRARRGRLRRRRGSRAGIGSSARRRGSVAS